jgi:hypothetical protein
MEDVDMNDVNINIINNLFSLLMKMKKINYQSFVTKK